MMILIIKLTMNSWTRAPILLCESSKNDSDDVDDDDDDEYFLS